MTSDEAKAVAAFLEADSIQPLSEVVAFPGKHYKHYVTFATRQYYPTWSDADLLLALLERAKELKLGPALIEIEKGWRFDLVRSLCAIADGPTPLSALVAAVCRFHATASEAPR